MEVKISGINLRSVKSLEEQEFYAEKQISLKLKPRHAIIKDPTQPNRVTLNDSGVYEATLLISELVRDSLLSALIDWLLKMVVEGNISHAFQIGRRPLLKELEKEYQELQLKNLCAEEEIKYLKLKIEKIFLEEQLKKLEKKTSEEPQE